MTHEDSHGDQRGLRLAASPDTGQIAVCQPGRALVLNAADLAPIAELGLAGELDDNDIAFAGPLLVVLARSVGGSKLHVVDPTGPSKLYELSFRAAMRIAAVSGAHILVTNGGRTEIVDLTKPEPVVTALPVRGVIAAAGTMSRTGFVIAAGDTLEEWDAISRKPLRRVRLGRVLDPRFVGGQADRIWMVSRRAPRHIEIVTLASSSSRTIELGTEIQRISANPRGDRLAVICGETRSPYILHVALRVPPLRIDRGSIGDVAWLDADTLVLQTAGHTAELLTISAPSEQTLGPDGLAVVAPARPVDHDGLPPPTTPATPGADRPAREDSRQRLAAWRARVSSRAASRMAPADPAPAPPVPAVSPRSPGESQHGPPHAALQRPPGGWRAELARWARAVCARSDRAAPALDGELLDVLIARLELDDDLRDAVALLYGAYLNGLAGVAPVDLAAVTGWNWDEAVGDGRIVRSGIVYRRRGRLVLGREAIAALDGRPPCTGTIVGLHGTATTTGAIVAPGDIDVLQLGAWASPIVGALLVPNRRGECIPERFLLEARIRGLVPLVPWMQFRDALKAPPRSAAILVEHATAAACLDLPVVATWPAPARGCA